MVIYKSERISFIEIRNRKWYMDNENLYQTVKNKICDEIYAGHYNDGDMLPSERELERILEVSRVTVRRSLQMLEEDGLIVREVGRGTKVTFHNNGNPADLDMIVLVAPARNPFFSEFIGRFQAYAETRETLVLYVEKPRSEGLEKSLYRLYKRGLRNVVVWLEDLTVDEEKLQRLRAIGMNLVFFDSDRGLPYADCVALNNDQAVGTLCRTLKDRGYTEITYVGWDMTDIYSIRMREEACRLHGGKHSAILRIPWKKEEEGRKIVKNILEQSVRDGKSTDTAVICCDRECGVLVTEIVAENNLDLIVASVDELPSPSSGTVMYRQDMKKTVEQIFTCLEEQCSLQNSWKADMYLMEGQLVEQM